MASNFVYDTANGKPTPNPASAGLLAARKKKPFGMDASADASLGDAVAVPSAPVAAPQNVIIAPPAPEPPSAMENMNDWASTKAHNALAAAGRVANNIGTTLAPAARAIGNAVNPPASPEALAHVRSGRVVTPLAPVPNAIQVAPTASGGFSLTNNPAADAARAVTGFKGLINDPRITGKVTPPATLEQKLGGFTLSPQGVLIPPGAILGDPTKPSLRIVDPRETLRAQDAATAAGIRGTAVPLAPSFTRAVAPAAAPAAAVPPGTAVAPAPSAIPDYGAGIDRVTGKRVAPAAGAVPRVGRADPFEPPAGFDPVTTPVRDASGATVPAAGSPAAVVAAAPAAAPGLPGAASRTASGLPVSASAPSAGGIPPITLAPAVPLPPLPPDVKASYVPGTRYPAVVPHDTSFQAAPMTPAPAMTNYSAGLPDSLSQIGSGVTDIAENGLTSHGTNLIGMGAGDIGRAAVSTLGDMTKGIPAYLQSGADSVKNFAGNLVNPSRQLGGQSPLSLLATGITMMDPRTTMKDAFEAGSAAQNFTQAPGKHAADLANQEQLRRLQAAQGYAAGEQPAQVAAQARQVAATHNATQAADLFKAAQQINSNQALEQMRSQTALDTALINGSYGVQHAQITASAAHAGGAAAKVDVNAPKNRLMLIAKDWANIPNKTPADRDAAWLAIKALPAQEGADLYRNAMGLAARRFPKGTDTSSDAFQNHVLDTLIGLLNIYGGNRAPMDPFAGMNVAKP